MPERLRGVLDTNILVRAVLRPASPAGALFEAFRLHLFDIVTSGPLLDELVRVLLGPSVRRVATITEQQAAAIRACIEAEAVVVPGAYQHVRVVPTDTTDDLLFAAALEGRATYIVSGDLADVRPVKVWKPYEVAIQVVSASYFANEVLKLPQGTG